MEALLIEIAQYGIKYVVFVALAVAGIITGSKIKKSKESKENK